MKRGFSRGSAGRSSLARRGPGRLLRGLDLRGLGLLKAVEGEGALGLLLEGLVEVGLEGVLKNRRRKECAFEV